ncbi:hypothetical protein [Streptomyces griseus]|uniref:hypothetical protein n=1 Tax=Streptomyces griseus TaxID=1911 RepID=UPI000563C0B1|nr:hypothetical protein [Streptomyces griseus]
MRSLKVTFCAGAAVAVAALAPAAYAADGHGVSVTPSTPAPGADVTLRVADCSATTATAASAAFVTDAHLAPAGTEGHALSGETRVRTSARPGTYEVRITCAASDVTSHLTVATRSSGHGPHAAPLSDPVTPASPVAPVHAGGGGTAHLSSSVADTSVGDSSVADARAAGPGTAQEVTGLVLAGVAAVAVALRSARRGHGTD